LTPSFPETPPIFSINPIIAHPWIDSQGCIVGYEKLKYWTLKTNLGKLVQEMIQELPNQSSQQIQHEDLSTTIIRTNDGGSSAANVLSSIHDPILESIYGEIKKLTAVELNELLHSDTKVAEYVRKTDVSASLRKIIGALKVDNEQLAKDNLSYEPKINAMKQRFIDKEKLLKELSQEYQTLLSTHQDILLKHYSKEALLAKLKEKTLESDRETEQMSQLFLEGTLSADQFVRDYRQSRKKFHLRAAKVEKLSHYLNT
jgi:ESCRT-I complex subunit VPS37